MKGYARTSMKIIWTLYAMSLMRGLVD